MRVPGAALRLLVLTLAVAGCSEKLAVQVIRRPDEPPRPSKVATCPLRLELQGHRFGPECREVGDVFVGDAGSSRSCGYDRVLSVVREEACRFGADAVQIVSHNQPRFFGSTCHQLRARFMACDAPKAVTQ